MPAGPSRAGDGRAGHFRGRFFELEDALIVPAPSPPIPLVVGGRSEAALVRAGRRGGPRGRGDPSTFQHAMNVWCGFGGARDEARAVLAAGMEHFYRIPFESFERYSPYGTPQDVAEFLEPYVAAGCTTFNVIPCTADAMSDEAAVGEVRRLLRA